MTLRRAEPHDAAALSALGRRTFIHEFGHLYAAQDLADYLDGTYTPAIQAQEIAAPDLRVTVVEQGGELTGYAVSGPCKLPVDAMPDGAYELRRIYLSPDMKGNGLGSALLADALDFFREEGASAVYVGVWSENRAAQAFYRKAGFEKIGDYRFMVGNHADAEWIMQLKNWRYDNERKQGYSHG